MKIVIQRVNYACVKVNNKNVSHINKGILVFLGISKNYNEKKLDWMIKKVLNLRIFESDRKGFDLSVKDIGGEILVISQFTLYGVIRGNKPDFRNSHNYDYAKKIYDDFIYKLKQSTNLNIKKGIFGEMMDIELENDGPVTMILEK